MNKQWNARKKSSLERGIKSGIGSCPRNCPTKGRYEKSDSRRSHASYICLHNMHITQNRITPRFARVGRTGRRTSRQPYSPRARETHTSLFIFHPARIIFSLSVLPFSKHLSDAVCTYEDSHFFLVVRYNVPFQFDFRCIERNIYVRTVFQLCF